ncbi:MAG: hypothetical protein QOJ89_4213 [bacterium]
MRSLLALLLVAVAWLCAALPATAAQGTLVAGPTFVPEAGPVLAGDDGVVWLRRRDDAVVDLWVFDPAHGARRIQRFVAADGNRLRSLRVSASATAVALELVELSGRGRSRVASPRSYAGAFGQPLAEVPARLAALSAGAGVGVFTDVTEGRAVWVARRCRSAQIRTITLPLAAPLTAEREPRCRLRLRAPARLRGGRLRLGVSCAGFAIDCAARVVVRARGRVIARGTASYNHATPPFAAASLRVTAAGLRLLRRSARTRMQISARINGLAARRATVVVARR